eukprot:TRINITY_DN3684_c0_g1_i3.p1 TRINITY_DN3684_c0_g1~~TRINITY_DN3684_c0_g1_i3.p1  ORF type:complete len:1037 (+),score=297.59 TRINITY_DN3684_c0_g1_i3:46-3156(+)
MVRMVRTADLAEMEDMVRTVRMVALATIVDLACRLDMVRMVRMVEFGNNGQYGQNGRHGQNGRFGDNGGSGMNGGYGQNGQNGRFGGNGRYGQNGQNGRFGDNSGSSMPLGYGQNGQNGRFGNDGQYGQNGGHGQNGRFGDNGGSGMNGGYGQNGQNGRFVNSQNGFGQNDQNGFGPNGQNGFGPNGQNGRFGDNSGSSMPLGYGQNGQNGRFGNNGQYGQNGGNAQNGFGPNGQNGFGQNGRNGFGPNGQNGFGPNGQNGQNGFGPNGQNGIGSNGQNGFGPNGQSFYGQNGINGMSGQIPDQINVLAIEGDLLIDVADPESFVQGPEAKEAIEKAIINRTGVESKYVVVNFTYGSAQFNQDRALHSLRPGQVGAPAPAAGLPAAGLLQFRNYPVTARYEVIVPNEPLERDLELNHTVVDVPRTEMYLQGLDAHEVEEVLNTELPRLGLDSQRFQPHVTSATQPWEQNLTEPQAIRLLLWDQTHTRETEVRFGRSVPMLDAPHVPSRLERLLSSAPASALAAAPASSVAQPPAAAATPTPAPAPSPAQASLPAPSSSDAAPPAAEGPDYLRRSDIKRMVHSIEHATASSTDIKKILKNMERLEDKLTKVENEQKLSAQAPAPPAPPTQVVVNSPGAGAEVDRLTKVVEKVTDKMADAVKQTAQVAANRPPPQITINPPEVPSSTDPAMKNQIDTLSHKIDDLMDSAAAPAAVVPAAPAAPLVVKVDGESEAQKDLIKKLMGKLEKMEEKVAEAKKMAQNSTALKNVEEEEKEAKMIIESALRIGQASIRQAESAVMEDIEGLNHVLEETELAASRKLVGMIGGAQHERGDVLAQLNKNMDKGLAKVRNLLASGQEATSTVAKSATKEAFVSAEADAIAKLTAFESQADALKKEAKATELEAEKYDRAAAAVQKPTGGFANEEDLGKAKEAAKAVEDKLPGIKEEVEKADEMSKDAMKSASKFMEEIADSQKDVQEASLEAAQAQAQAEENDKKLATIENTLRSAKAAAARAAEKKIALMQVQKTLEAAKAIDQMR